VPPSVVLTKIVTAPGHPAYLSVVAQNHVAMTLPGSPVITSDGTSDPIVWVVDAGVMRTDSLTSPTAKHPVLYAFDALTLKELYRSNPSDLNVGGKYDSPTIARGTVFFGTDRIQAFGLSTQTPTPTPTPTPIPTHTPTPTPIPTHTPTPTPTFNPTPTPAPAPTPSLTPAPAPGPVGPSGGPRATRTVLIAKPKPGILGRPVTLTATVETLNRVGGTPSGFVTFWDGADTLGTVPLLRGKATLKISGLQLGKTQIRVDYTPAPGFNPSSAAITENVQQHRR
jgi:hypothetical protein